MIQHDNLHPDQDKAIADTIQKIREQGAPVLAILPGAETGGNISILFSLSSLSLILLLVVVVVLVVLSFSFWVLLSLLFFGYHRHLLLSISPSLSICFSFFFLNSSTSPHLFLGLSVSLSVCHSLYLAFSLSRPSFSFSPTHIPYLFLSFPLSLHIFEPHTIPLAEGVELAERMACRYGTRNNGEAMTHARRNKFDMQEVRT